MFELLDYTKKYLSETKGYQDLELLRRAEYWRGLPGRYDVYISPSSIAEIKIEEIEVCHEH